MVPQRSDGELVAAIEAMYRIRAVESPPDEHGQRTVWHRAQKNAELVTWVDKEGRVARQELMLFEDILIWERAGGLKTGAIEETRGRRPHKPSDSMTIDGTVNGERLARLVRALSSYSGEDRFIVHVRQQLKPAEQAPPAFENRVTRPSNEVQRAPEPGEIALVARRGPRKALVVVVGAAVALLALLALVAYLK